MKTTFSTVFLATALGAQQAAATFSWGAAKTFGTPENCDNKCSSDQSGGYSWGGISTGSFSSFDDFEFSGFTLQNSFKGKRDLTARTSDKCITGQASKGSDSGSKSPSFSCSKRPFSVDTIDISVEYPTDLEFVHTMKDGSTCKHVTSCSGRSTVKNTQCGGSQGVTVQLPHYGSDKGCGFGIHSIGFDCNPGSGGGSPSTSKTIARTTSTAAPSTETSPAETTATAAPPSETAPGTTELPPPSTATTVASPTTYGNLSLSITSPTTAPAAPTTSTFLETSTVTDTACGPEVTNCPGSSTVAATASVSTPSVATETSPAETPSITTPAASTAPPAVTTVFTVVTTSVCPITSTVISGSSTIVQTSSTISTITLTQTSTVCSKCTEAGSSTTLATVTAPPATTATEVAPTAATATTPATTGTPGTPDTGCPEIVPSCLNTWLSMLPDCKDNSDVSCFCPSSQFTDALYSCIQAHGADDSEVQAAASYFAGICAAYVPQNPGIVTACPSTVTLTATPAAGTVTVTGAAPPPVTTISISVVVSSSTITSAVTVPQVVFTTATVTPNYTGVGPSTGVAPAPTTPSIGLIPGTAAAPTSNPAATVTASTGFGSGSGIGSNTTITSPSATTSFTPFTGAAVKVNSRFGVFIAVAAAGLAIIA